MKRWLIGLVLSSLLIGCGSDGRIFRLQGRLRNLNQGEFLIYSPDGGFVGVDTIKVRDGRFSYEKEIRNEVTFVILFPNYSEQAVFAEPGEEVEIKGDATHLKEMTIKGTDDNDELTKLRQRINRLTPPEIPPVIVEYIENHPQSLVSRYLVDKYFILAEQPDYQQAYRLVSLMLKEDPDNGKLRKQRQQLEGLRHNRLQGTLPSFSVTDTKGVKVTNAQLKGKVNVITTWASWNHQSTDIQRRLQKLRKNLPDLFLLSICLDGDKKECQRRIERDSLNWSVVFDGKMFDSPLVTQLGMLTIPSMIVTDARGRIIKRNLRPEVLEQELGGLLK